MAQPVTIYRWDDPGAPQIVDGKPSEIIEVIYKCAVTGYGDKAPLGWTRPFYDEATRKAAFRNSVSNGGSGGYLRIWDQSGNDAVNGLIRFMSAVSMTDIDTTFNPGFFDTISTHANSVRRWVLIGTATGFYIFTEPNGALMAGGIQSTLCFFAGDIFSLIPNDAGRFVAFSNVGFSGDRTAASSWNNNFNSLNHNITSPSYQIAKMWDADSGPSFRGYAIISPFTGNMSTGALSTQDGAPVLPQIFAHYMLRVAGTTETSPGSDRNGIPQWSSEISPLIRGVLPGLLMMRMPGYRTQTWPTTFMSHGKNYWLVRNPHAGAPCVCVEMEEWNDPFIPV